MKVTLLFLLVFAVVLSDSAVAGPLDDYRWDNRILIVIADEIESDKVREVSQILADAECALQDRDMLVSWIYSDREARLGDVVLTPDDVARLRKKLRLSPSKALSAALVGKDGGVKARYQEWPALGEVFALIDGMPMRRAEMHADDKNCQWQDTQREND